MDSQWATTKAEFVEYLERQISDFIMGCALLMSSTIAQKRNLMSDDAEFLRWLKAEQGRANDEPALESFDKFQGYKTPREAAEELAAFIEFGESAVWDDARQTIVFDHSRVDWSEQHRRAAPVLAGLPDADGENWKYRNAFTTFIKAAKAIASAKELGRYIRNK